MIDAELQQVAAAVEKQTPLCPVLGVTLVDAEGMLDVST